MLVDGLTIRPRVGEAADTQATNDKRVVNV